MNHAHRNTPEPRALDASANHGAAVSVGSGALFGGLDLSQFSDLDVLRVVGEQNPEFVDILAEKIDRGWTDEQIIRLVCAADGSAQVMRYTQKCLRALRRLPTITGNPSPETAAALGAMVRLVTSPNGELSHGRAKP